MLPLQSLVLYFILVVVLVISDIYCGDGTVSVSRQSAPTPLDNVNPWQKLSNQNPVVNPSWGDSNQHSTTTPWPALGARRPVNQKQGGTVPSGNGQNVPSYTQTAGNNANRNIGVELSYGLNPGQGTKPINQNQFSSNTNRNIGVDLSYGLNPGGNQNAFSGTSQSHPNKGAQTPGAGVSSHNRPLTQNPTAGIQTQNQANKAGPTPGAGVSSLNRPLTQNPTAGIQTQNQANKAGQTPGAGVSSFNRPSTPNPAAGVQSQNLPQGQTTGTDQKRKYEDKDLSEDDELKEFSEALLKKDVNNAAKYVTVNFQGKTTSRSATDEAPDPLLTVKPEALDIPTIARMLLLHNNYILETNVNEYVTPQEKSEENSFLDEILSTSVMQHTRNFLIKKGKISKDPKDFRDKLKEMWFNMYSRGGGKIGSSGFEHVFLAELKGNDVSGLHNWLYFNEAESKKQANYLGYMKKIEFGNKGAIVKYHFLLSGKDKPVGSMFIGTSPELELALYSTCFLMRANKVCPLRLGGKDFIIRTFTFRYRGKNMVGSAFPEI